MIIRLSTRAMRIGHVDGKRDVCERLLGVGADLSAF
jgi:hypothetical protein